MPRLSEQVITELEAPITQSEMEKTILQSKLGKAPGPDGFSLGYYKIFSNLLLSHFVRAINAIILQQKVPSSALEATISVIKEGKDPSSCNSYWPISLLNVDTKLFVKVVIR